MLHSANLQEPIWAIFFIRKKSKWKIQKAFILTSLQHLFRFAIVIQINPIVSVERAMKKRGESAGNSSCLLLRFVGVRAEINWMRKNFVGFLRRVREKASSKYARAIRAAQMIHSQNRRVGLRRSGEDTTFRHIFNCNWITSTWRVFNSFEHEYSWQSEPDWRFYAPKFRQQRVNSYEKLMQQFSA